MLGLFVVNALQTVATTTAFSSFVDGVVITVGTYAISKGAKNAITIKK